jgi:hypothetical protein
MKANATANKGTASKRRSADVPSEIALSAKLLRPAPGPTRGAWTFLRLTAEASAAMPSRGQVAVEGTLNGVAFAAILEPDGEGGHWLKVPRTLRESASVEPGDMVVVMIRVSVKEPEPRVPEALRAALRADAKAAAAWKSITPAARRDFVHWITSAKQQATRARRVGVACDMLSKGKRRPCCFDRSGMYAKSLSCPAAEPPERDSDQ